MFWSRSGHVVIPGSTTRKRMRSYDVPRTRGWGPIVVWTPAGRDVVPYVMGGEIRLASVGDDSMNQTSLAPCSTSSAATAQSGSQENTGAPVTSTVAVTKPVEATHVMTTLTDAGSLAVPEVAVIVAVPLATAVTSPVDETVATDELEDTHVTDAPLIVAPF